jgi:hypothetical protein
MAPSELSWRARAEFVCAVVVAMGVLLGAVSFATDRSGTTTFGRPLGEDFALFYIAASSLNHGMPHRLYDTAYEDRAYHRLVPRAAPSATLPYLYPPFVAEAVRPLAHLSYRWAFAVWLVVQAGLYAAGLALAWAALGGIGPPDRRLVLLACLAFEPFLFECLLGGQLSALAFAAFAGALYLDRRRRPFAGGLSLGVCLFKPTLLAIVVPLLLLKRAWRMLGGAIVTGGVLAEASVAGAGWATTRSYIRVLLSQVHTANGAGAVAVRRWKFVDLNSFLRLLTGDSVVITVLVLAAMVGTIVVLHRRRAGWAAVLTATLAVNVYVGVYDTVLVVLAGLLTYDLLRRRVAPAPDWVTFRVLAVALFVLPLASQALARSIGFQPYTLGLLALLGFQLHLRAPAILEA